MKRGYISCPKCGGTGIVTLDSGKKARCNFCYSSGEVPKEKTMQTNEEWFDGLSTEEKAKFFHGIVIRAMQATWDGKKPDYPAYLSDWKKWLKEKHDAE